MTHMSRLKRLKKTFNPFNASKLAVRNTRWSRFLNKLINNCQVDKSAVIDSSLKLSHCGASTVIGKNVIIGKSLHIYQNVTIGTGIKYADEYPVIEDNVTIYPGCVIIGNITIGEGSTIGAHSFIKKDVPSGSVAYNESKMIIRKL